MPSELKATCPKCGKEAEGSIEEIKDSFGLRTWKGRTFPQSYCKDCRKNHNKDKN